MEPIDLGIPGLANIEQIGSGGNAVVFRARQTALDRDVVVKVLFAADEATQRRFDRERRAMGRLSQAPGIAPVYDSGFTPSGQPWLLMPYYERGSLQAVLDARGQLGASEVRDIGVRVARAVQTAHDNGVVHRDIKPANILVSRSGTPDVADFGIAHLIDDAGGRSQALTMTPLYTAPEVFEGADSGAASDIYSLGALLYALAAGRAAYATNDGAPPMLALIRQINEEPLPPLPDTVPRPLASVITRAMSKAPASRFSSAAQLADALAALDFSTPATAVLTGPQGQGSASAVPPADAGDPPDPGQAPSAPQPGASKGARWLIAGLAAAVVAVLAAIGVVVATRDSPDDVVVDSQPTPTETVTAAPEPTVTPTAVVEEPTAVQIAFDPTLALGAADRSTVTVEAFSCSGAQVHTGVVLADGRILTAARVLLSPWLITVTNEAGGTSTAAPLTGDLNRRLALVDPDIDLFGTPTEGSVGAGDRVVIVQADGRSIEADVLADPAGGPRLVADLTVPQAVSFDHAIPAFGAEGDLVAVAIEGDDQLDLLPIADFERGWNRIPPRQDCRSTVRDLSGVEADQAMSIEMRELLYLQRLTDAFADERWDDVREWEPGKAALSDQQFLEGWGPLRRSFLYPVDRVAVSPNETLWRLGLIGHETWFGADLTTLFCVTWQVDPETGVASQTNRDTVRIFGSQPGQPQQPGFVDPADFIDTIDETCALG